VRINRMRHLHPQKYYWRYPAMPGKMKRIRIVGWRNSKIVTLLSNMTTKTPRSTILEAFFICRASDVELLVEFKCDEEFETLA
jgi:hypothetical protein